MFFRANIDEVETEVVEIEAKLDKVRRDVRGVGANLLLCTEAGKLVFASSLCVQYLQTLYFVSQVILSLIWWVSLFSLPVKQPVTSGSV